MLSPFKGNPQVAEPAGELGSPSFLELHDTGANAYIRWLKPNDVSPRNHTDVTNTLTESPNAQWAFQFLGLPDSRQLHVPSRLGLQACAANHPREVQTSRIGGLQHLDAAWRTARQKQTQLLPVPTTRTGASSEVHPSSSLLILESSSCDCQVFSRCG